MWLDPTDAPFSITATLKEKQRQRLVGTSTGLKKKPLG
jgi:hypothetical protein